MNTPESVGNIKLVDSIKAFPEYRSAAEEIISIIKEGKENPQDFYVEIEKDKTKLIFHLWHISAFSKENCNMEGNPGGLCRDVVYDLQTKKVTEKVIWQ